MKGVVLLSGGLDSTTLLYHVRRTKHRDQLAIGFNYGQRHSKELLYAQLTCDELDIPYRIVDLSGASDLLTSALTDPSQDIPDQAYDVTSQKSTVVPNRNAIMLSIAVGWAISQDLHRVYYAAHYNDHTIYPDCRWEFVQAINLEVKLANNDPQFEIRAPFVHWSKARVVDLGAQLNVPFERTWSCYKGEDLACGTCGTCRERIEAFRVYGRVDPIPYAIDIDWRQQSTAEA